MLLFKIIIIIENALLRKAKSPVERDIHHFIIDSYINKSMSDVAINIMILFAIIIIMLEFSILILYIGIKRNINKANTLFKSCIDNITDLNNYILDVKDDVSYIVDKTNKIYSKLKKLDDVTKNLNTINKIAKISFKNNSTNNIPSKR